MNEKVKIEPLLVVREVLPGDKITLQFQKGGYIYFQAIETEKLWTQPKEQTK